MAMQDEVTQTIHSTIGAPGSRTRKFAYLLLTLPVLLVAHPYLTAGGIQTTVLAVVAVATLFAALYAVSGHTALTLVGLLLAAPTLLFQLRFAGTGQQSVHPGGLSA